MNKFLLLILSMTSIYANPPCPLPDQKICMYLYKGAMSSEIIITNQSTNTIIIERGSAICWMVQYKTLRD